MLNSYIYAQVWKDAGGFVNVDGINVPGEGWLNVVAGSTVTKLVAFAGKGTGTPFRNASYYAERYGGSIDKWQKVRGEVLLDYYGAPRRAEIHWAQEVSVGRVRGKFKRWLA